MKINTFNLIIVGISFWIIYISLAAKNKFLVIESFNVKPNLDTYKCKCYDNGNVAAHYFYMRNYDIYIQIKSYCFVDILFFNIPFILNFV